MKVILKETIESLGIIGSEVEVADGYARNYLLPQNKAVLDTPQNRKVLEQEKAKFELQIAKERKFAVRLSGYCPAEFATCDSVKSADCAMCCSKLCSEFSSRVTDR